MPGMEAFPQLLRCSGFAASASILHEKMTTAVDDPHPFPTMRLSKKNGDYCQDRPECQTDCSLAA